MMSPTISSMMATLLLSVEVSSISGAPAFVGLPCINNIPQSQNLDVNRPLRQQIGPPSHKTSCETTRLHSGSGFGNTNNSKINKPKLSTTSKSSSSELFELQELRAQLQTILKTNVLYQTLSTEKRAELTKYVKAVVEKAESPIDFSNKSGNTMGIARFVAGIEGKSWRMVYSTEGGSGSEEGGGSAGGLPYGSTVVLRIGEFMGTDGKMDYLLKFNKQIMGLNELVAKSTCSVDIGVVNPGLFSFEYEDIKTNIFGISNLPVGFFGLLKGRVNYIDTVWFDGERWIERNYAENGDVVYSVYVRDEEDEKSN
mmetsp:Transcript_38957/g.81502  ORF Transcript_38957/g.81502 Transcript_38957/m.81502 type:complete len:312 (+) Transcript_38957:192-1127(+)